MCIISLVYRTSIPLLNSYSSLFSYVCLISNKIWRMFTLEVRIAFDKHRNKFVQTHRRTFICRWPTLGFTDFAFRSASYRYSFVLAVDFVICLFADAAYVVGALIFSNSEIMRRAWGSGRSGLVLASCNQVSRASGMFVSRRPPCRLVNPATYLRDDLSTQKHWFYEIKWRTSTVLQFICLYEMFRKYSSCRCYFAIWTAFCNDPLVIQLPVCM